MTSTSVILKTTRSVFSFLSFVLSGYEYKGFDFGCKILGFECIIGD